MEIKKISINQHLKMVLMMIKKINYKIFIIMIIIIKMSMKKIVKLELKEQIQA